MRDMTTACISQRVDVAVSVAGDAPDEDEMIACTNDIVPFATKPVHGAGQDGIARGTEIVGDVAKLVRFVRSDIT